MNFVKEFVSCGAWILSAFAIGAGSAAVVFYFLG